MSNNFPGAASSRQPARWMGWLLILAGPLLIAAGIWSMVSFFQGYDEGRIDLQGGVVALDLRADEQRTIWLGSSTSGVACAVRGPGGNVPITDDHMTVSVNGDEHTAFGRFTAAETGGHEIRCTGEGVPRGFVAEYHGAGRLVSFFVGLFGGIVTLVGGILLLVWASRSRRF